MDKIFKPHIYSYLVLGSVEKNYLRLKQDLLASKVNKYQIIDWADSGKKLVSIEEVRSLRRQINIKPLVADQKIYILVRGKQLGIAAQNSLLKLVEEPPGHLRIVILCQDKSDILVTLVSRCLAINLISLPGSLANLELYPKVSQLNIRQLFQLSEKMAKQESLEKIFDSWLLTNCSLRAMTETRRKECFKLLEAKRLLLTTNVNRRLLLDNLLIGWKYDI